MKRISFVNNNLLIKPINPVVRSMKLSKESNSRPQIVKSKKQYDRRKDKKSLDRSVRYGRFA